LIEDAAALVLVQYQNEQEVASRIDLKFEVTEPETNFVHYN
jgi:hypothetical protein